MRLKTLRKKLDAQIKKFFSDISKVRGMPNMSECAATAVSNLAKTLGMPPSIPNKFRELDKHQTILRELPLYRDHFLHSFHVFSLGYKRITSWWDNNLGQDFGMPEDDFVIRRWFAASICHDIAYAIEKIPDLINVFFKETLKSPVKISIDWSPLMPSAETNTLEYFRAISEEFSEDEVKRNDFERWLYARLIEDRDHGVLGALVLMNLDWDSEFKEIARKAGLDVAMHNYHKRSDLGQLSFTDYPFAYLLSYCDEVQEWGRDAIIDQPESGIIEPKILINRIDTFEPQNTHCVLQYQSPSFTKKKMENELNNKSKFMENAWEKSVSGQNFSLAGLFKSDSKEGPKHPLIA